MTKRKTNKKPINQYEHKDKKRINNPPVGLVTPETDKIEKGKKTYAFDPHIDPELQFDSCRSKMEKLINNGLEVANVEVEKIDDAKMTINKLKQNLEELQKMQGPYLNWAGKAEHTTFEVPTVSLHVHERIDPRTIIEAVHKRNGQNGDQLSLFSSPEENPPLREAIEFYKHKHNWSNRLISGDSLLVMNSLLEKESLAGQVQMIYIDPPYGIKYGSNFQPFVNKRDVKDGKDEDLTAEPEMIKAFRDTWELGIHSYLTYMCNRLLLARDLLSESGSIFVQISDENIHHVRELMDAVFGSKNFVRLIFFRTTSGLGQKLLDKCGDYLIWYAKDITLVKYRHLFVQKSSGEDLPSGYNKIILPEGEIISIKEYERRNNKKFSFADLLKGARLFALGDLKSQSGDGGEIEINRIKYSIKSGSWKTNQEGINNLNKAGRLSIVGNTPRFIRYFDDFPFFVLDNMWSEQLSEQNKDYVVQTSEKVLQRCLLMTTDPGDLMFDPTCGSGTTAFVAEQWGRRWITCDTSRVATTLAKQRLMTALYDYNELAYPDEGVGSGFKYKTVPHITLKSIANNEPPRQDTLYDQPFVDKSRARVAGPFTVEAVPAPVVKPLTEIEEKLPADESIARSGESFRQAEWRDELLRTGIRAKNGQYILFSRIESLAGTKWLHAEAETKPNDNGPDMVKETLAEYGQPQRVVISFGPEHAPLEQRQVELAWEEARTLIPHPKLIIFVAFQFDPEAAKDIDEINIGKTGMQFLKVQMNADLQTDDLKKKRAGNESFWLMGQPDVELSKIENGENKDKYQVEVLGFDYYNTKTGTVDSGGNERIAMWMLDTDYNGRSLFPKQVFFPMSGEKDGWSRLAKNLKAEIDEELIEAYRGTVSLPFEAGYHQRVAVKIIDDRGIESLRIINIE